MISLFLGQILEWLTENVTFMFAFLLDSMAEEGLTLFSQDFSKALIFGIRVIGTGLWGIGCVLAVIDFGILYCKGKQNVSLDLAMNLTKAYLAAALFWALPVPFYRLMLDAGTMVGYGIAGGTGNVWSGIEDSWVSITVMSGDVIVTLVCSVIFAVGMVLAYIHFLKRSFYLLTLMCTGCLYMVSVPRGFMDGFVDWCKQVIGLGVCGFLQISFMCLSFSLIPQGYMMLGLAGLFASREVDRLLQRFGGASGQPGSMGAVLHTIHSAQMILSHGGSHLVSKPGKGAETPGRSYTPARQPAAGGEAPQKPQNR